MRRRARKNFESTSNSLMIGGIPLKKLGIFVSIISPSAIFIFNLLMKYFVTGYLKFYKISAIHQDLLAFNLTIIELVEFCFLFVIFLILSNIPNYFTLLWKKCLATMTVTLVIVIGLISHILSPNEILFLLLNDHSIYIECIYLFFSFIMLVFIFGLIMRSNLEVNHTSFDFIKLFNTLKEKKMIREIIIILAIGFLFSTKYMFVDFGEYIASVKKGYEIVEVNNVNHAVISYKDNNAIIVPCKIVENNNLILILSNGYQIIDIQEKPIKFLEFNNILLQ